MTARSRPNDDTEKGIRRFAREVYPRLKELRVESAQEAQIAR